MYIVSDGETEAQGVKSLTLIIQKVAVSRFNPVSETPKCDDSVVSNSKAPSQMALAVKLFMPHSHVPNTCRYPLPCWHLVFLWFVMRA